MKRARHRPAPTPAAELVSRTCMGDIRMELERINRTLEETVNGEEEEEEDA